MRLLTFAVMLAASALLVACVSDRPGNTTRQGAATPAPDSQNRAGAGSRSEISAVPSHGGGAPAPAPPGGATRPEVATPELDAKIQQAEAKAKAEGATESDRRAAAAAYFGRANFFRDAGNPRLYKFALADYRRGLRYDPTDRDARAKLDEIVGIYQSMRMPVPDLGNEQ